MTAMPFATLTMSTNEQQQIDTNSPDSSDSEPGRLRSAIAPVFGTANLSMPLRRIGVPALVSGEARRIPFDEEFRSTQT
ncbi:MAG TPA: hypothetical protein VG346_01540 [Acidimicrobiales bacterium]|jgi:hypothetical protein|nr:hypothetical protein [Acidimicrobiales bacterium]